MATSPTTVYEPHEPFSPRAVLILVMKSASREAFLVELEEPPWRLV